MIGKIAGIKTTARCLLSMFMVIALAMGMIALPASSTEAEAATEADTLSELVGISRAELVEYLESHEDDSYYLGTVYKGAGVDAMDYDSGPWWCNGNHPSGTSAWNGSSGYGMNCAGFVARVLCDMGAEKTSFMQTWYGWHSWKWGNAEAMTQVMAANGVESKTFYSVADLLDSGYAEKGDLIYMNGPSGLNAHIGIFWGDTSDDNRFWHSNHYIDSDTDGANQITKIYGKGEVSYYQVWKFSKEGWIELQKKSADTSITKGNGCYSLKGAKYGIYASKKNANNDEDRLRTLTTDDSGYVKTKRPLEVGTYYVKEVKAPDGYALDGSVYEVEVKNDKTATVNTKTVSDNPKYDPVSLIVQKLDADTGAADPEGDGTLAGARFTVKFYGGQYSTAAKAEESGDPLKTWVLQTDEDGNAYMLDDYYKFSGDEFYKVDGKVVLPLGTVVIQETKAPDGYNLDDGNGGDPEKIVVNITDNADETEVVVSSFNSKTSADSVMRGGVMVGKGDALLYEENGTGSDGCYCNYAQGDATLEGAEFTIYNESENAVAVDVDGSGGFGDDESFDVGDAIMTISTAYDSDLDAYVARTADDALPYGTYRVEETKAPTGYTSDGAIEMTFSIREDGEFKQFVYGEGELNEVIVGGVQVQKNDLELGKSEALAGNSHDTKTTGSTLSGIEFTIWNSSNHGVMVDGEWYHVGDKITTITTHWNEAMSAYTAETDSDVLPYGTYTIRETATNDTYLLTDGGARTFEVREDGKIVTLSKSGSSLVFSNQVVRNDLEIAKKADSDNRSLMVPFKVENVSTGEAHVIVTDRNGNASTAASWNKHSYNTNGNDGLLDAEAITASDMDTKAGVWFSLGEDGSEAAVDDSLAAMPYGEYRLTELRCEDNAGLQLVSKTLWIERDSGSAKAIWLDIDDKDEIPPEIGTTATDGEDGDKIIALGETATIVDTVSYEGLTAGIEHSVHGILMVKSTGEALTDADGLPVTAAATFTPEEENGTVDVIFEFDSRQAAGESLVVFESLRENGLELAVHESIDDKGQTVGVEEPSIATTATDADDGDHEAVADGKVELVDAVAYCGLKPGVEYVATGTLMDKSTGEALTDADGDPITAQTAFTPDAYEGTVEVAFAFDGSGFGGVTAVAFEALTCNGNVVAVHEDIDDEDQTVKLVEADEPGGKTPSDEGEPGKSYPKTGAKAAAGAGALAAAGCAIAAAVSVFRRRRVSVSSNASSIEGDK